MNKFKIRLEIIKTPITKGILIKICQNHFNEVESIFALQLYTIISGALMVYMADLTILTKNKFVSRKNSQRLCYYLVITNGFEANMVRLDCRL
jgi:hypothetical protein